LFDHVWDRFWRRMDGLDDEEWRWAPTADPRISLRWRLGHIRRLLGEDATGNNTVCTFNFKTRMDPMFLVRGYQTIMRTIYGPREYYQRVLDSLGRTRQDSIEQHGYSPAAGLASLMRILVKLGVLDRERKEFWRFFVQALIRHRSQFADSLRLAAVGYHFRKLSDAYGENQV